MPPRKAKFFTDELLTVEDIGVEQWDILCNWLATRKGLVGHNIRFDLMAMTAGANNGGEGVTLANGIWDTMLAAKELWPNKEIALKPLAHAIWPEEDPKAEMLALKPYKGPRDDPRYDLIPWKIMEPYAVKDAELTWRLYERQVVLAEEGQCGARFIGAEFKVLKMLLHMETTGLPFRGGR